MKKLEIDDPEYFSDDFSLEMLSDAIQEFDPNGFGMFLATEAEYQGW